MHHVVTTSLTCRHDELQYAKTDAHLSSPGSNSRLTMPAFIVDVVVFAGGRDAADLVVASAWETS
jgi:hypothetical protein